MRVLNIHERTLAASADRVGALIDTLSSRDDALWPRGIWPAMRFDRPLQVGAVGGHGPIRYFVDSYAPGRHVRFRFTGPSGFDGYHEFEVRTIGPEVTKLRHTLSMIASGFATLSWPAVYRPLHDALIEDSLSCAQRSLGLLPEIEPWSQQVRVLRWVVTLGRGRSQLVSR